MKAGLKIILPALILLLFSSPVLAKSGCCSSHGGVNCAAGPQSSGNVICNDGWRGSSCSYAGMVMCGGNSASAPVYTIPPTVAPIIIATISPTVLPTPTQTPTETPTSTPALQVKSASTSAPNPTPATLVSDSETSGGSVIFDILIVFVGFMLWKYRKVIKERYFHRTDSSAS